MKDIPLSKQLTQVLHVLIKGDNCNKTCEALCKVTLGELYEWSPLYYCFK